MRTVIWLLGALMRLPFLLAAGGAVVLALMGQGAGWLVWAVVFGVVATGLGMVRRAVLRVLAAV